MSSTRAQEWLSSRAFDPAKVEIGPCPYSRSENAIWLKSGGCTCRNVPKRLQHSMLALIGGELA